MFKTSFFYVIKWYNKLVMYMKVVWLILISLIFTGCTSNDKEVLEHIKIKNREVDVYSKTYLYDLLETKDIEIISKNELLNTKKLGNKKYILEYEYDNKKYEYELEYKIVDREPPRYFGGTNKTIVKNYEGDLCNLIMYGDNYDGNLSCTIDGKFSLGEVGTYKVVYNITDSSNNTTKINVTLNVIEKSSSSTSNSQSKKTYFEDIVKNYKTNDTEVGIDVSKWQGDIDYEKVKNAGATFVMMRIGVQTKQNGELSIDPYFEQNIKNAKSAGLKVGVYLYSIATNSKEAIEHANWVIKTLDNRKLDLPIVFDWENWSKWNTYKMSFYEINDIANKFMETVTKYGYEGMLYSSKYYLENIWTNEYDYPVWLAHYTSKTSYKGNYMMWQLSNTGRIDGIYGDVDINVMYKK